MTILRYSSNVSHNQLACTPFLISPIDLPAYNLLLATDPFSDKTTRIHTTTLCPVHPTAYNPLRSEPE